MGIQEVTFISMIYNFQVITNPNFTLLKLQLEEFW